MGDEYVVDEGVSGFGMHRLHVLGGSKVEAEKWIETKVGEGCVSAVLEWMDEVGMHHLKLYWREAEMQMEMVTIEKGQVEAAVQMATAAWERKTGGRPNRIFVGPNVKIEGDAEEVSGLRVERKPWIQPGCLAVAEVADGR